LEFETDDTVLDVQFRNMDRKRDIWIKQTIFLKYFLLSFRHWKWVRQWLGYPIF
jgi:hypothetical protein